MGTFEGGGVWGAKNVLKMLFYLLILEALSPDFQMDLTSFYHLAIMFYDNKNYVHKM